MYHATLDKAIPRVGGHPILPDVVDVIACVMSEVSAIDCKDFEDWASNYGYDTDSRKAEGIYRMCVGNGLVMRASLGGAAFDELVDLCAQW